MPRRVAVRLGKHGLYIRLPREMSRRLRFRRGERLEWTAEADGSYRLAKVAEQTEFKIVARASGEADEDLYELPIERAQLQGSVPPDPGERERLAAAKRDQEERERIEREQAHALDRRRRREQEQAMYRPPAPYRRRTVVPDSREPEMDVEL
jgi:hypothetical protein